jgi:hypothetical protein
MRETCYELSFNKETCLFNANKLTDQMCTSVDYSLNITKGQISAMVPKYCKVTAKFIFVLTVKADHSGPRDLRNARTLGTSVRIPRGMDVCVRLFCVCVVLCVGNGLATG